MRNIPDYTSCKRFHLSRCLEVLAITASLPFISFGQPSPGPIGPGPGCNVLPAPPSVGATVDLSYFGPPPSASNPSLVGPYQLLKSGTVDVGSGTVTLPLYKGTMAGSKKNVWYILTDVNDTEVATSLGLNFSGKLNFAGNAVRTANIDENGDLVFDKGTVDFRPARTVVPGPSSAPFPPTTAKPGSIGDSDYSPLVRVVNGGDRIYNAPIVAFDVAENDINYPSGGPDYTRVHDEVLTIDPFARTVTLQLINGFSFGHELWYMSMDASLPDVAAIEGATFAPALQKIVLGKDDSFGSAVERLFVATNGPSDFGCDNPQRQGLYAALTDGFRPNNIFGGIPTVATDYSPLWNGQLYEWTPDSVSKGFRGQLRGEFQVLTFVQDGLITGPNGTKFGSAQFIVNCPPVQRLF